MNNQDRSAGLNLREKLDQLETVLAHDHAALERLKSLKSPEELAQALARLGGEHGIDIEASSLCALASQTSRSADVSDEELDLVAGGGALERILIEFMKVLFPPKPNPNASAGLPLS